VRQTDFSNDEAVGFLADLVHHGDRWRAVDGGRGGKGNARFLSNRRRAPSFAEQGERGQERWLKLEIKLMADVALVGFPNAGKSTLISRISSAKPKIADYPFTTLVPNLGVVRFAEDHSFVVADIPGIIEGAHEGKGLGLQFLRHIERTRLLAFLIPIDSMDWQEEYDQLRREVGAYSAELLDRPHCVVFTKLDLLGEDYVPPIRTDNSFGSFAVSAPARQGLDSLLSAWWTELLKLKQHISSASATPALP
jgi:GTP-binding protein